MLWSNPCEIRVHLIPAHLPKAEKNDHRECCKVVGMENQVITVHIDFVAQYGYNIIRILLLQIVQEQEVLL